MAVQICLRRTAAPDHPDLLSPIFWRDGRVVMIDQRRLPDDEIWNAYDTWEDVARAIADLEVRGAPAIGCAGAFAVALAAGRASAAAAPCTCARSARREPRRSTWAPRFIAWRTRRRRPGPASGERRRSRRSLAACPRRGAHGAALLPDEAATRADPLNGGAIGAPDQYRPLRRPDRAGDRTRRRGDASAAARRAQDARRLRRRRARITAWDAQRIPAEVSSAAQTAPLHEQARSTRARRRRRPHRAQRRPTPTRSAGELDRGRRSRRALVERAVLTGAGAATRSTTWCARHRRRRSRSIARRRRSLLGAATCPSRRAPPGRSCAAPACRDHHRRTRGDQWSSPRPGQRVPGGGRAGRRHGTIPDA